MDKERAPGIKLLTVFLNHAHFEHRLDPLNVSVEDVPKDEGKASVEVAVLQSAGEKFAVVMTVSSDPEDVTARYMYSVQLTAVFAAERERENMSPQEYAVPHGAALLFPFAREAVGNITARGHFGPVWLNPMNMFALLNVQGVQDGTQDNKT